MISDPVREALPGDVWLFARKGPGNMVISIKTWSRFTHIEIVSDTDPSVITAASRNGIGVGLYRPDLNGLALVLRPIDIAPKFSIAPAMEWFKTVEGQGYDWLGLLNFTYAKIAKNNNKQFCSEFLTRFLRKGGLDPFPENDADTIAPRDFALCPWFKPVWRSDDEWQRFSQSQISVSSLLDAMARPPDYV